MKNNKFSFSFNIMRDKVDTRYDKREISKMEDRLERHSIQVAQSLYFGFLMARSWLCSRIGNVLQSAAKRTSLWHTFIPNANSARAKNVIRAILIINVKIKAIARDSTCSWNFVRILFKVQRKLYLFYWLPMCNNLYALNYMAVSLYANSGDSARFIARISPNAAKTR